MSSRQLRKLRKQQDLLDLQHEADREDDDSGEEPEPVKPRASAFSAFAALGNDGGDEDDDEDDAQQDTTPSKPETQPSGTDTSAPAKKSKKSKKKKKAKKAEAAPVVEEAKTKESDLDEIDLALKELNISQPTESNSDQRQLKSYSVELARLLSVNTHHLKVIHEMRALFGREAIAAAQTEDTAEAQQNRRRQRQVPQNVDLETFLKGRPGEKIAEVLLKKNPFVDGKDTWPRASAGGLKMEIVPGFDNVIFEEFTLSHDTAYDLLEAKFFAYVQMHDPMQLVYFLHGNPYHVSTLIQVSRVAKQDQNSALSADLCERALFTIGRVTLSAFRKRIEQGTARMDFKRPENRQFWLVGYHYIKSLLQKGTYRTALEWCKLFLSLSPEDDYGLMNWVHALAIRAHQGQWYLDLCRSPYFSIWKLAMAPYYRQTAILAELQVGDEASAIARLVKGMQELPWLYDSLCSELGIDSPRAVWGMTPRNDDEDLYTRLYIHTAKDLWNNAQATSFLKEAGGMAHKLDPKKLAPAEEVPLSIARFVYLDNTPALMSHVPRAMLHATPNFDFDPLPPPKDENIFSNDAQTLPWEAPGDFWQSQVTPLRRRANIPAEQLQQMQAGLGIPVDDAELEGELDALRRAAEGEEEDDLEMEPEEVRGFLQRVFDIFRPLRTMGGAAPDEGPGMWVQDDDDQDYIEDDDNDDDDDTDIPPLENADQQRRGFDHSDSDDDMPPLEPVTEQDRHNRF